MAWTRTCSGALGIANERPATWNIGTSFTQSPTTTASPSVQPAPRHSSASAVPFVGPAVRTSTACLPGHMPIAKVTEKIRSERTTAWAASTASRSPIATTASGSVSHARASSTMRTSGDHVLT